MVVLGITFVVFMIMQIVPGDPARVILGPYASDEVGRRLCAIASGLDRPFFEQYADLARKSRCAAIFGQSLLNGQDVAPQLVMAESDLHLNWRWCRW